MPYVYISSHPLLYDCKFNDLSAGACLAQVKSFNHRALSKPTPTEMLRRINLDVLQSRDRLSRMLLPLQPRESSLYPYHAQFFLEVVLCDWRTLD